MAARVIFIVALLVCMPAAADDWLLVDPPSQQGSDRVAILERKVDELTQLIRDAIQPDIPHAQPSRSSPRRTVYRVWVRTGWLRGRWETRYR